MNKFNWFCYSATEPQYTALQHYEAKAGANLLQYAEHEISYQPQSG